MGNSGLMYVVLGIIIMGGGYLLRAQFNEWDMPYLYYVVEATGLVVFLVGGMAMLRGGKKGGAEDHPHNEQLTQEVALKALSRMTYADTNTQPIEVATVKKVYKKFAGKTVTDADIRVAARGDLHEDKAFRKYLRQCADNISSDDKCQIMRCLADVIKADGSVSPGEVAFFDEVGEALKLSAADIADLKNK